MAQGLSGDVENRRGRDPDCVLEGKLASVPKVPESDEETKQLAREGPFPEGTVVVGEIESQFPPLFDPC